jgi:hypothetical protein
MAKFRKVHTSFWDDPYIEKLSAEDRYFYLFLLTNPLCTECGIYPITLRKMTYYTGYSEDVIKAILKRFIDGKRIVHDTSTDEICILHKPNYIDRLGKPVVDCLISELKKVKNKTLINRQLEFVTRIEVRNVYDTLTIRRQEEEKEEEKEEVPKGTPEAIASLPSDKDLRDKYKEIVGDKEKVEEFITAHKPKFVEPYVNLWNILANEKGISVVQKINDSRRKKIKTRCSEADFDFIAILNKIREANDFLLLGKWFTFDWILENDSNYITILEGKYDKVKRLPLKGTEPTYKSKNSFI